MSKCYIEKGDIHHFARFIMDEYQYREVSIKGEWEVKRYTHMTKTDLAPAIIYTNKDGWRSISGIGAEMYMAWIRRYQ
jgi:hypothetical protein